MGVLFPAIDSALGDVCGSAEAEQHAPIARGLLQSTVDAVLRVLLHGGPNRFEHCPYVVFVRRDDCNCFRPKKISQICRLKRL